MRGSVKCCFLKAHDKEGKKPKSRFLKETKKTDKLVASLLKKKGGKRGKEGTSQNENAGDVATLCRCQNVDEMSKLLEKNITY